MGKKIIGHSGEALKPEFVIEIMELINEACSRAASAVNAVLTIYEKIEAEG